ncbi:MAG TPA: ATP-binding protein [Pyrinomonadaceae bacterium]|jgi:ATP-dependent DNA helicase RecG|nr:ATP-binding protein [Pyrinomonadaceae bacterium]
MKTPLEELIRWMTAPRENENLEFKAAKNQYDNEKACAYCVAIANEGGGKLILGVSDSPPRKIVSTAAFNDPAGIQRKIYDKLRIRVEVEELYSLDGRVVIFHIPSRPRGTAYNLEGAYLMRAPDNLVPMTEDQLRKIFDEGKPDWLMQIAREDCTAGDVIRLLDTQSYFDLLRLPYPANQDGVLERFKSEKLVHYNARGFSITNLGAILFAKQLDGFPGLFRKASRVLVYDGTNKLAKSRLIGPGNKGYAIGFKSLLEVINTLIPANEVIEDALRHEFKMFPEIAIRELVANALIHQDFNETGTSVTIELYSDRIEISNPGMPIISPDRFIDEYQSRNEKLADIMRRLGVCEEQGKGIDKVINGAEVWQLPAPDFRQSERQTHAVMFAHKDFEEMDRKDRIRACFQHCVLRWMMNQKMTNTTLRDRFKLPESRAETASRIIRDAIEEGRIKLDDPTSSSKKFARYIPYWA